MRGAEDYWIDVGTGAGKHDTLGQFSKGQTSIAVDLSGHPTGETVHLQIYTVFPDVPLTPGSGAKFRFSTRAIPGPGARSASAPKR